MAIFFHKIPRKSKNPPENSFEWRFSSFREVHFALVFPCEWSGRWNHMRTSKVFRKSERVDDSLQFRPLICLLFERSKKSHDLQEIIDFPELIKNLVHVSRNIFQNSCRKWKFHVFRQKTCSVESLIRLRDERPAKIMIFSEIHWKNIDLTSVKALPTEKHWISSKKASIRPRFFPFLRVLRKTTFRRAYDFPRLSATFFTPRKMLL